MVIPAGFSEYLLTDNRVSKLLCLEKSPLYQDIVRALFNRPLSHSLVCV